MGVATPHPLAMGVATLSSSASDQPALSSNGFGHLSLSGKMGVAISLRFQRGDESLRIFLQALGLLWSALWLLWSASGLLWAAPGLLWAALEGHALRVLAAPAPAAATATADATGHFNFPRVSRTFARVVPPIRIKSITNCLA